MTAVSRGEDWVEGEGGGNARGESRQLQCILLLALVNRTFLVSQRVSPKQTT